MHSSESLKLSINNASSFGYDPLDQLTSGTGGWSYTWDANGNRTADSAGAYAYTAQSNRMASNPSGAVTLDAAGNTLADQGGNRSFAYNQAGRRVQVSLAGALVGQYDYAFDGHRVLATAMGTTTLFHYGVNDLLLSESDAAGAAVREYVWDDEGRPLAQFSGAGLTYRGYDVRELAADAQFEEVAYLLLYGELPTQAELAAYSNKLSKLRDLPQALKEVLERIPADAHPMDVMRTGCSFLGNIEPEKDFSVQRDVTDRLLAAFPAIMCYWYRFSHDGQRIDCVTDEHCPPGNLCVGNLCVTGCSATRAWPGHWACGTSRPWPFRSRGYWLPDR